MPETVSIALELPKDFVNRVKSVKPPWLTDLTEEQFIGHVIAHGDFDDYLQQIQKANQQVQDLTTELQLKKGAGTPLKGNKGGKRTEKKITAIAPGAGPSSPPTTT
jgi:hypothetical protein